MVSVKMTAVNNSYLQTIKMPLMKW